MRIGVVSDTHGQILFTRQAVRILESLEVDEVLHCGDIGSPEIVRLFAPWPTHFVFGNVDDDERELRAAIAAAGKTCHGRFGELELGGVQIALLHGDDSTRLKTAVASGRYQLVCSGHTHVARKRQVGTTLDLNPGALYRADPHSFAIVELPTLAVTQVTV